MKTGCQGPFFIERPSSQPSINCPMEARPLAVQLYEGVREAPARTIGPQLGHIIIMFDELRAPRIFHSFARSLSSPLRTRGPS